MNYVAEPASLVEHQNPEFLAMGRWWVDETCTAEDMRPLAEAAGFQEGVHKWKEDERAQLRAELDAAYFILYGLSEDDVEYILTTFQGIAREDEAHGGVGPTRQRIRAALAAISP